MNTNRRTAVAVLAGAGLLWGTSVPLTKLALEWLPPAWLTVARFGLAAAVLLGVAGSRVRGAWSPAVLAWGAVGYGGSILVQNAGITRTSVSHAALLVGATPVLVAGVAAVQHRRAAPPVAWTGFGVSFAGVALVAAGGGAGATLTGDALVLASLAFSAAFTVAQARLLRGRDPVAVTAVQFVGAALMALPVAAVAEGPPVAPAGMGTVAATAGLTRPGDARRLDPLRLRPGPGLGRGRRRLRQPGAPRRRGRRRPGLRRPVRPGPGGRGRGHPRRDRPEQPAAATTSRASTELRSVRDEL